MSLKLIYENRNLHYSKKFIFELSSTFIYDSNYLIYFIHFLYLYIEYFLIIEKYIEIYEMFEFFYKINSKSFLKSNLPVSRVKSPIHEANINF